MTKGRIQPAVNLFENHPYFTQTELLATCKKHRRSMYNIAAPVPSLTPFVFLISWLSLVGTSPWVICGALRPLGSSHHPLTKPGKPILFDDPKIHEIGKKYNSERPHPPESCGVTRHLMWWLGMVATTSTSMTSTTSWSSTQCHLTICCE